jgi:solute carrier family 50 protein (sugar transporter)
VVQGWPCWRLFGNHDWLHPGMALTLPMFFKLNKFFPLQYEDPDLVEQRFGLILTVLLYAVIASPMVELKEVIRNKSTEGLPFPIMFMGFLVGLAWLLYGIILNNSFVILQNLVAVLLSAFQLSFFLIYPSKKVVADKKKKKN